ncbi:hypothetical protein QBC38DRAFT_491221 [Podospora fimiseda]|uniref:Secreted protein n=1 Tax=Podospora fimiseda TaxID=252190 RepID=A0AAN6YNZ7_9PEZI|nr:hypothetical protein QBC38DRAFT_491221 [Podospora fimiseda]
MRFLLPLLALSGLASAMASVVHKPKPGPRIFATHNEIDDCEMNQAIECLQDQICARRNIPYQGKIRCTIGTSVAYVCNYKHHNDKMKDKHRYGGEKGGELWCNHNDMYEAWRQIRIAKGSKTGWWHDKQGKRTFGFDKRCKDNTCDNGWKKDNPAEQCTNIHKKAIKDPWLFDFEAIEYHNYTGKYEQDLPVPGDEKEPVYFNPWQEGIRPRRTFGRIKKGKAAQILTCLYKPGACIAAQLAANRED